MKTFNSKLIAVLPAFTLLLAACSNGDVSETGNKAGTVAGKNGTETPEQLAKKAAEQQVELVFASSSGATAEQFMELGGNEISKKFPNYKITFVNGAVQNLMAANQTIDIFLSSVGLTPATVLSYNLQSDISDLIKKYNYNLSRLESSTIDIQRELANGGIYGLPVNTVSGALFYNKDLFDRFGTAYPRDGMNWDELYDLARKMTRTEGGTNYRGLTFAFQHMMFLNQYSAPHLDPKTNKAMFMQDGFVRAFENMARFYKIPGNGLPNHTFSLPDQQNPFFKEQTIAMLITLSGGGAGFGTMNWDMVQMPFLQDKSGIGPQSYPAYYYITSMSKKRDAAFQVLAYVTSDEFQEWQAKGGTPSILKDQSKVMQNFGVNQPLYKGKNMKAILPAKFAAPTMKTRYQGIADKEVLTALNEYSAGKDINSALREAAERTDKLIAAEVGK